MADEAERAYRAAVKLIEKVRKAGGTEISFFETRFRALTRIPVEIAQIKGLTKVDLDNTQIIDLSPLGALRGLEVLYLNQTQVADLSPLAALTGLRALSLNQTQVADLSPLAALTGLQRLDLNQTEVDDLSPLAALTGLQQLDLNQTQVADLSPLAALTGLQVLWLNQTRVADLSPLAALTGLQRLDLNQTEVDDLSPLAALTGLQVLWLNQTRVADLSPLAALTGLQGLDLNQTQVDDLSPLAALTGLQVLWLNQTRVADLSPLAALTGLQQLWLTQTQIIDLSPLAALTGLQGLYLNQTQVDDLSPLAALTGLQRLDLNQTEVDDLSPLAALTGLQRLDLNQTQVADLSPLAALIGLQVLELRRTQVADLRPIKDLPLDAEGVFSGLWFANTPATKADPKLARLAAIKDRKTRTTQTLAYFKTLPPWPEPLPWLEAGAEGLGTGDGDDDDDDDEDDDDGMVANVEDLTVEILIKAQDQAGWRYSTGSHALELYVRDLPEDARQSQLAKMVADRARNLLDKLGARVNSGGFRQEVHQEATRFSDILADDSQSLSVRVLDLWGSLIALGSLLEENDAARKQGRDPLDLLTPESRAALNTFIGVAASLVRSFPEARALDEDYGGFHRRSMTRGMVLEILEDALRVALIDPKSGALIQHVAQVGTKEGRQGEKADTVTMTGIKNLILSATLIGSTVGAVTGGIVGGIANDIGTDISNHLELGEKATQFLDVAGGRIDAFLDTLTPDEKARLKAVMDDAARKRSTAQ